MMTEREVVSWHDEPSTIAGQAAKRLKVSAAAFRWARHAGLIPDPDLSSWQWSLLA